MPHCALAVIGIAKIKDYCLNPLHLRGRHKARVFREALGLTRKDAEWLRDALLAAAKTAEMEAVSSDVWGEQWRIDAQMTRHQQHRRGEKHLDHSNRRVPSPARVLLGVMTNSILPIEGRRPELLDVVALLVDHPNLGLARGAVGTVLELLRDRTALVEFSDDTGRAQAIVVCPHAELQLVSESQT